MAQVLSAGYEPNPFSTFKTKRLPRTLNPCCSKATEFYTVFDSKQQSKAELVLLQGKRHDAHLLSKLSPYFRGCVSQELLKAKLSTSEKLPSLCYSCNRTLDRRLEQTISFNRIKLKRRARAIPALKDNKDEDTAEQLTTTPRKYSREQQYTFQAEASCTPFQRFEKAQSFVQVNKPCCDHSSPLILPEVIKINPQRKKTQLKANGVYDVGLVPPPTPIVRYIRDLSPEMRNLFAIGRIPASSP